MCMDFTGRQIVGIQACPGLGATPGLWIDRVFTRIPVLPGDSPSMAYPTAISRNGRYCVGSYGNYGAIWKDLQGHQLVAPSPGAPYAMFFGVADHGRLAFNDDAIWTREGGLQAASSFLAQHGAPVPAGWGLRLIETVSSDGSVFAGSLFDPVRSIYRGFIAYTTYKPCFADFNSDGGIDGSDIEAFFRTWESGDDEADVNLDGGVDGSDIQTFFVQWEAGGCKS